MKRTALMLAICFGSALVVAAQPETIPSGTNIPVRTNETIDVRDARDGRIYQGVVDRDVLDRDGRVAIQRGMPVELIVRDLGRHTLAVDLDSVSVGGRRYSVDTYDVTRNGGSRDGVGANGRTGKFVGGGALLGTIIGAIAGGGKGAAIGAVAGSVTGAGAQMATRGDHVRIPVESQLTFQLQRPLTVIEDHGYDRDGHHYHRDDRDNH